MVAIKRIYLLFMVAMNINLLFIVVMNDYFLVSLLSILMMFIYLYYEFLLEDAAIDLPI